MRHRPIGDRRLAHGVAARPGDHESFEPYTGHTVLRLRPEYPLEGFYDLFDAHGQGVGIDGLLATLAGMDVARSERITLDFRLEQIRSLESATEQPRPLGSLDTFWRLDTRDLAPDTVDHLVGQLNGPEHGDLVELAYREGQAAPPPNGSCPNAFAMNENFEPNHRGPLGINSESANGLPGGTGSGIAFIDVEANWCPSHSQLGLQPAGAVSTIVGDPYESLTGCQDEQQHAPMVAREHGTAVLGIVRASPGNGVAGIAPDASPVHLASWRFDCGTPAPTFACCSPHLAYTLLRIAWLRLLGVYDTGDVVLLEYQQAVPGSSVNSSAQAEVMPAEVELHHLVTIRLLADLGLTVVEPAGNSGLDLATWQQFPSLNPGQTGFFHSGAIVVGAACPTDGFPRHPDSNYGDRVDCFAWGHNVRTLGTCPDELNPVFGRTSAAAAIIAGACLLLQSRSVHEGNGRQSPTVVRNTLRNPANGTASAGIGVMPDLTQIL